MILVESSEHLEGSTVGLLRSGVTLRRFEVRGNITTGNGAANNRGPIRKGFSRDLDWRTADGIGSSADG